MAVSNLPKLKKWLKKPVRKSLKWCARWATRLLTKPEYKVSILTLLRFLDDYILELVTGRMCFGIRLKWLISPALLLRKLAPMKVLPVLAPFFMTLAKQSVTKYKALTFRSVFAS